VLCAIHQPNFFPWAGYFDKIRRADVFVFLDDVAYPRAGSGGMGSWTNRVKLNIQGQARWFGCPIRGYHGIKMIREINLADDEKWRARLVRTLAANYARSAAYRRAMDLLVPLIENPAPLLADYNIHAINVISNALGLRCRFIRQSEIGTAEASTKLLVEIVQKIGASTYLSGGGAGGYQVDELFSENGIVLQYQYFTQRPYLPRERYIPGLSIIDFMMTTSDWHDFPSDA